MLSFIHTLSRKQKGYVLLGVDLLLVPLALLFTYTVNFNTGKVRFQSDFS